MSLKHLLSIYSTSLPILPCISIFFNPKLTLTASPNRRMASCSFSAGTAAYVARKNMVSWGAFLSA